MKNNALVKGITFVTDQRKGEPDILKGYENSDLIIKDLNGNLLHIVKPIEPWTHDSLCKLLIPSEWKISGCDAYLGDQWIGSTEV